MNRIFYRSLITNKIFDNTDVDCLYQIDNGVSFKRLIDAKKIVAINTPTIEDAINHCIRSTTAVFLYRDKYDCSLAEASYAIRWLRGDEIRF